MTDDVVATPGRPAEMSTVTTWLNHHSALEADWDAVGQADEVGIDGTLLQLMLSLQGASILRSSADLDLPAILAERYSSGRTIAFVGGAPGVARAAAMRFPGVVLALDGYADVADNDKLVEAVTVSGATIVVLGLGAPLQDRVAIRLRADLQGAEIYTAGGWLDQLASAESYFPPVIHTLRLGWLWRLLHEPRRLARRYTVEPFLAAVRLRHIAARLQNSGLRVHQEKRFFVRHPAVSTATRESDRSAPSRVVQIVTQLERAGAQTLSWWLETKAIGSAGSHSYFLYRKSGSELFDRDRCLTDTRPGTPLALVRMLIRLRGLVRGRDAVIAHTHYAIAAAVLVTMTLTRPERPQVVAVHHWPISRYPIVAQWLYRLGVRSSFIGEEVFVSSSVRPEPAQGVVIENPVPRSGGTIDAAGREPDLLVVARHAEETSVSTAIDALHHLPDRSLTLVGEGPLTSDLKAHAVSAGLGDRVEFAGSLPNEQVRSMMACASALVLPSLWEAMPMVLLEGIASSVPLVVSRIEAHEFLRESGAALTFEVGNASALAESICALEDVNVRRSLDTGVARVREHLSEAAVAERWQLLLDEVLGRT